MQEGWQHALPECSSTSVREALFLMMCGQNNISVVIKTHLDLPAEVDMNLLLELCHPPRWYQASITREAIQETEVTEVSRRGCLSIPCFLDLMLIMSLPASTRAVCHKFLHMIIVLRSTDFWGEWISVSQEIYAALWRALLSVYSLLLEWTIHMSQAQLLLRLHKSA